MPPAWASEGGAGINDEPELEPDPELDEELELEEELELDEELELEEEVELPEEDELDPEEELLELPLEPPDEEEAGLAGAESSFEPQPVKANITRMQAATAPAVRVHESLMAALTRMSNSTEVWGNRCDNPTSQLTATNPAIWGGCGLSPYRSPVDCVRGGTRTLPESPIFPRRLG
jgi:hypothetical protein